MGRDKRKTRLDKGGGTGGEFVGFSAFAAPSTSLKASPVYTGSDSQLSLVFKRITQKRDAVTKTRALNELQAYFDQEHNRKDQVDALSHLVFVYHSKINYDDASSVRAAAISCMNAACKRLPKAWNTLVAEQQPEVSGMMWCGRADSAAEVRVAAACFEDASQTGVIQYVTRILGYNRPRTMHDALFARKQETDPPDRDELDERYERIVGTALGGMDLWIQAHPETDDNRYSDSIKDGILWSSLNSSKSSLRRKTYSLLATLCQYAKSLVYGEVGLSTLPKLLTNALTQEKDAVNIPSLFEVLLLYLNNFPNSDPWKVIDAQVFVKGLGKQLKKACHGASATQWGPSMLPLLASIADDTYALQLQLLKNMSTGMDAAIGPGDSLLIAAAIAECASFFLLRRETETENMDADVAKQFADYWLQVLGRHLSSENMTSMAKAADATLLSTLSESFYKMDDSSSNRPYCAIYRVHDWFWTEALKSTVVGSKGVSVDGRWAEVLNSVMKKRSGEGMQESHADPVVRSRFHVTLSKCQDESRSAPDVQAYDLMIASIRYAGAKYIFTDGAESTSLEQFLVNDLLRWIVMDTSSLSMRKGRRGMVKRDFSLLRDCLVTVSSPLKQKTMWEAILRETIAAQCDLGLLADGLVVLTQRSETMKDMIRCDTLDNFAIKVAEEAVTRYHDHFRNEFVDDDDDETYEDEARKTSLFLGTCVGLAPGSAATLVSQKVVHGWAEVAAPEAGKQEVFELGGNVDVQNPVVSTLLSLLSRGDVSLLTPDDAERIILESWRRGGKQWSDETMPLLLDPGVAQDRRRLCSSEHIIKKGTKEVQDLLGSFCHITDNNDFAHVALVCHVWSERSFRILSLCSGAINASDAFGSQPQPSLALIGLADLGVWKSVLSGESSVAYLYLCFVYVLQQFDSKSERLELFLRSSDNSSALLVNILLAISDADSGVVVDPVTRRDRKCAFVLSLFGGKELPNDLRQSWCREAIHSMSAAMKSGSQGGYGRVTRGASVLSELLFTLFGRVVVDERLDASTADDVVAAEVREGDELWYVVGEDQARAKAQVVKIHSDDFPRLYFTIRVEGSDGVEQERQTVAERLKIFPQPPDTCGDAVLASRIPESEKDERVHFGSMIFEELVKPVLVSLPGGEETTALDAASECVNIVISHCGLVGKEGVASTRYEVFKWLSSLQAHVIETVTSGSRSASTAMSLKVLALAMGLGNVVPAAKNNFKLMKFVPDDSVQAIVQNYNSSEINSNELDQIDRAVLQWLTVAIGYISDDTIRKNAVELLYRLASTLVSEHGRDLRDELANSVLVMRAVQNADTARIAVQDESSVVEAEEKDIMSDLVLYFTSGWPSAPESICQYEVLDTTKRASSKLPDWYEPFQSLLRTSLKQQRASVVVAARSNCDMLVENLFSYDKHWLAFRLLDAAAADGEPLRLDYYIGYYTEQRLATWQEDLVEQEAEELEDDVGLVGQWIPETMMNELGSWEDNEDLSGGDEGAALGRMLCWLSFLSFVDRAAAVDIRFRGSASAYLDYVDVKSVLGTALSYLNLEKDRNSKQNALVTLQEALNDRSSMELSKVAGLVMFRTVQSFPTHFKHWWESDCPKNRSAAVSQFVETKIAPEALRRELSRINDAADLGEMTVSGSTVSRQVTATYFQDECQLSIAIQIPPNFPLRNVEVDGRLTLGIPEKRWKRWALQIRQMLNNQDGTLLDALMLWKENVDKDFAGLEPCPVCYSILSVKTHELPNLECNTCNNCFHSSCLYKWFHSSGKSNCVICQQPWSGTRIQRGG